MHVWSEHRGTLRWHLQGTRRLGLSQTTVTKNPRKPTTGCAEQTTLRMLVTTRLQTHPTSAQNARDTASYVLQRGNKAVNTSAFVSAVGDAPQTLPPSPKKNQKACTMTHSRLRGLVAEASSRVETLNCLPVARAQAVEAADGDRRRPQVLATPFSGLPFMRCKPGLGFRV